MFNFHEEGGKKKKQRTRMIFLIDGAKIIVLVLYTIFFPI
jgi:hypothetical protein